MSDMQSIAQKLNNITKLNFVVKQEAGCDVIKCDNPVDALDLTSNLKRAGFNAAFQVEQSGQGEGLDKLSISVTIREGLSKHHDSRTTDIETAMQNFEQGKIAPELQPQKQPAQKDGYTRG